jgi:hypothetical protein
MVKLLDCFGRLLFLLITATICCKGFMPSGGCLVDAMHRSLYSIEAVRNVFSSSASHAIYLKITAQCHWGPFDPYFLAFACFLILLALVAVVVQGIYIIRGSPLVALLPIIRSISERQGVSSQLCSCATRSQ